MVRIPQEAINKFKELNKDGNNALSIKNDKITNDIAIEFFIPHDNDMDLETFYKYNADKFGGEVPTDIETLRNVVRQKHEEIKNKQKPEMGLSSPENVGPQKAKDEDAFYLKPIENTYIEFMEYKILYKDGVYQVIDQPNIEPAKNIYTIRYEINLKKREETRTKLIQSLENAQNKQEKRKAVDSFIENLLSWNSHFDPELYKINPHIYSIGSKHNFKFAGYSIYYTIGEDYKPIINMESLYKQAGCAE